MLAKSEFIEFLELFDNDLLGVVLILTTVGTFVTAIVTVVSVSRTWNNLAQQRMNQSLMKDLLSQGYSVDDIERLVHGSPRWTNRFKQFVKSAKDTLIRRKPQYNNQPMPPVKQQPA